MIHGYFPAVDSSPPTMRVVPSWPHLQAGAVVVVAPDAVVVVVAPATVVVAVVAGAAVVVVQHGLVGKVGVKSMPNLASWLLLQSRQVPGLAGGGTYSMPTVSRIALITARGSDWPLTIGWRKQMSSASSLIPAANSDPD